MHDVERASAEMREIVRKPKLRKSKRLSGHSDKFSKSHCKQIPLTEPQALALIRYKNQSFLSDCNRQISNKVTVKLNRSIPALLLFGDGDELIEAHVILAEEMMKYNDLFLLSVRIETSEMGKFIGKDGRNIKSLELQFDEVRIMVSKKENRSFANNEPNITLLGRKHMVDRMFFYLQSRFNAKKISRSSKRPEMLEPSPEYCSDDDDFSDYGSMINDDENSEECVSENISEKGHAKVAFLKYIPKNPIVMRFISNSEIHLERLRILFPDESVLLRETTVFVAGETNDSESRWREIVIEKLDNYFDRFKSCEVDFCPGTSLSQQDTEDIDVVVDWDKTQSIAVVCGVRKKVDEKVEKLECIKNKQLSVLADSTHNKHLIASKRQTLEMHEFVSFFDRVLAFTSRHENIAVPFPPNFPKKSTTVFSVEVVEGDIVNADVDVIVNTTDKNFSYNGPLSQYIFSKAGHHILEEMTSIDDEIRISGSGDLSCREIFHIAIPQTNESMEASVFKILKLADERGFSRIALPAIGAGHGGWKVEEISKSFQTAFNKFKTENSNIKLIKIVLSPMMPGDERVSFHENVKIKNEQPEQRMPTTQEQSTQSLLTLWRSRAASTSKSDDIEEGVGATNTYHKALVIVSAKSDEHLSEAISDIHKLVESGIKENKLDSVSILKLHTSVPEEGENITSRNVSGIVNVNERIEQSHSIPANVGQTYYTATKRYEISKEKFSEAFMTVQDAENFSMSNLDLNETTFKYFCEKTSPLVWEEIQLAHEPLTKSRMHMISFVLNRSCLVDELALRDCAPTAEQLETLCLETKTKCEISEFSLTGEDDISTLISVICKILKVRRGKVLNLSDNNLKNEEIALLKDCLSKFGVTSLSSLDISNNEEISNYSTLANVLNTSRMSELRILSCDIIPERLEQLGLNLVEKLKRLDLSFNSEMISECFCYIGDLLQKRAEFLGLSQCDVTEEKVHVLFESFEQHRIQLNALDLSYNGDLRYGGVSVISRFIRTCKLTELSLAGCNIDADCIEILRKNLAGYKLIRLDLSDNAPMHDESIKRLGQMVVNCPIENLDLSNCALSSKQIGTFGESLGNSKLSKLDISDEQLTLNSCMVEAIKSVAVKVVDELTLCYENIQEFLINLKGVNKNLRIVYGYRNNRCKIDHVTYLPKIKLKKKSIE